MGLKLVHPQEVEVFYILPAIRKEFAKGFKKAGRKQTDIAKIFGVTEAAVSQYLSGKRSDISLDATTKALIQKAVPDVKDQTEFIYQSQQILNHMLKTRQTCHIHAKVNKSIGHDCTTCFECK